MSGISWSKLVGLGLVVGLIGAGCTVGDGDDDDDNNSGGSSSTGGTGAGGSGATGATGATGGAATGGAATGGTGAVGGTGGSVATGPVCDPPVEERTMTPAPDVAALFNMPTEADDPCGFCMMNSCATESAACGSTGTAGVQDDPCWVGGPNADGEGELFCFQRRACEIDAERGYIPGTDDAEAAGGCVTPSCGTPSVATSDAIACLNLNCFDACIPLTGTGCS